LVDCGFDGEWNSVRTSRVLCYSIGIATVSKKTLITLLRWKGGGVHTKRNIVGGKCFEIGSCGVGGMLACVGIVRFFCFIILDSTSGESVR